jgi:hypothetical protein
MKAGVFLRELSRLRTGLILSLLAAIVAAIISIYKVGLFPPTLTPRSLEIGAASTEVLVDNHHSTIADLRSAGTDFNAMTTRTDLLGSVMSTAPVKAYIGKALGIDPARVDITTPITASVPRVVVEPGSGQSAMAIVASADHYKLEVQADPSVPILHIYAQAPTAAGAVRLANASVDGLRYYLATVSANQRISNANQVRVEQFGAAQGGTVNGGVAIPIAILAFLATLGICCAATVFAGRVVRGFRFAGAVERAQA